MNARRIWKLLIAEDDDKLRLLLRAAAEQGGQYSSIQLAADGQEALDWILNTTRNDPDATPDFVLSDLSMPRMDGIELIRELKRCASTKHIPIAVMTSSDRPNDREAALAAGCGAFFYKPVRFEEFVVLIGSLPNICGSAAVATGPATAAEGWPSGSQHDHKHHA